MSNDPICFVSFLPKRRLVSVSYKNVVQIWDLSFSNSKQSFVTAFDRSFSVLSTDEKKLVKIFLPGFDRVLFCSLSTDKKKLVAVTFDNAYLYDLTDKVVLRKRIFIRYISNIKVLCNGDFIYSVTGCNTIWLYTERGDKSCICCSSKPSAIDCFADFTDDQTLITGHSDGSARLWKLKNAQFYSRKSLRLKKVWKAHDNVSFTLHNETIGYMVASKNGQYVVSLNSGGNEICLYDIEKNIVTRRLSIEHLGLPHDYRFFLMNRGLAVAFCLDNGVYIIDILTGYTLRKVDISESESECVTSFCVSTERTDICFGGGKGKICTVPFTYCKQFILPLLEWNLPLYVLLEVLDNFLALQSMNGHFQGEENFDHYRKIKTIICCKQHLNKLVNA